MCPIAHAPHHPCPPSRSIHYYGSVPHQPCVPLSMCPIAHVAYCPCAPLSYSHVDLEGSCCITHMPHHSCSPSPMCPITLPFVLMCPISQVAYCPCTYHPCPQSRSIHYYCRVPHHPCVPLSMCPIAHVPHPQGAPSLSSVLTRIPICPHVPLPICQKRCKVVKKMSSCQEDVKLSKRCQMSKSQTHGLWRRFTKK